MCADGSVVATRPGRGGWQSPTSRWSESRPTGNRPRCGSETHQSPARDWRAQDDRLASCPPGTRKPRNGTQTAGQGPRPLAATTTERTPQCASCPNVKDADERQSIAEEGNEDVSHGRRHWSRVMRHLSKGTGTREEVAAGPAAAAAGGQRTRSCSARRGRTRRSTTGELGAACTGSNAKLPQA